MIAYYLLNVLAVLGYLIAVIGIAMGIRAGNLPLVVFLAIALLGLDYAWRRMRREHIERRRFAMNIARYAGVDFGGQDVTATRVRCVVCRRWVPVDDAELSSDEPPYFICQECVE